ncbi:MAG: hypothetical protein ISP90_16970 [Nevskia sp.]|nr:hypothetical protein [Nevskia sp.]
MNAKTKLHYELICSWSGILFVVTYVACLGGIAGFLPPPSPNLSAEAMGQHWADHHDGIVLGATLASAFGVLLLPWSAQLSVMLARIEGPGPVLSIVQGMGGALTGWIMVSTPILWLAAAYRPAIPAALVQSLTDSAWMTLCMTYAVTTVQFWAIGLVGLADTSPHPLFPRWLCWLTLFTGTIWIVNDAIPYHKTGPLAWDGAITLYTLFSFWLGTSLLISVYMVRKVSSRLSEAVPGAAFAS